MSSRFTSNLALAVLAAVFIAMSLAFRPVVASWLALGFGCASVVVALVAFACRGRGAVQRAIDVSVAILGVWTVIAATCFGTGAARWLSFAAAVAIFSLSVIGLIAHEVTAERQRRAVLAAALGPPSDDGAPPAPRRARDPGLVVSG